MRPRPEAVGTECLQNPLRSRRAPFGVPVECNDGRIAMHQRLHQTIPGGRNRANLEAVANRVRRHTQIVERVDRRRIRFRPVRMSGGDRVTAWSRPTWLPLSAISCTPPPKWRLTTCSPTACGKDRHAALAGPGDHGVFGGIAFRRNGHHRQHRCAGNDIVPARQDHDRRGQATSSQAPMSLHQDWGRAAACRPSACDL